MGRSADAPDRLAARMHHAALRMGPLVGEVEARGETLPTRVHLDREKEQEIANPRGLGPVSAVRRRRARPENLPRGEGWPAGEGHRGRARRADVRPVGGVEGSLQAEPLDLPAHTLPVAVVAGTAEQLRPAEPAE